MMKNYGGIMVASFLVLLSIYIFFSSFGITSTANAALGPAFMPQAVSVILFLLGCVNLWSEIKEKKKLDQMTQKAHAETVTETEDGSGRRDIRGFVAAHIDYISGALLLVYVFSIKALGFLIASCLYMFVHMMLLTVNTKRNYVVIVLLTVIAPSIIYFGFVKLFYLMLPPGILG